eukprot:TRINITY_DN7030_c0_g1_i2.p1 TRINITY_DN7030_c0_g1~~TRINITY_DN7030_c0_g1_i2.p1  ORF type:complete len:484 (+),score=128.23 TRINITY_DN7030_c0_g1_i2:31-1452(+)
MSGFQMPAFGAAPAGAPAFGAPAPNFGAPAAVSAPAFGAAPTFGTAAPAAPAAPQTSNPFGAPASVTPFGAPVVAPLATPLSFGTGTPATGAPLAAHPFGTPAAPVAAPTASANPFGVAKPVAALAPVTGAKPAAPAFSMSVTPAGVPAAPSPFGSAPPATGAAPANPFGAPAPAAARPAAPLSLPGAPAAAPASTAPATAAPFPFPVPASTAASGAPTATAAPTTTTTLPATSAAMFAPAAPAAAVPGAPTAAPTATLLTAPAQVAAAPKPPEFQSQIKAKNLEEILAVWNGELDQHVQTFIEQARAVAQWDRLLIENGDKILDLHRDVTQLSSQQKEVDMNLEAIKAQQNDLGSLLQSLEDSVEKLALNEGELNPADYEREKSYQLAEDVNGQLNQMETNINDMIKTLNEAAKQSDPSSPMSQIVQILNEHLTSLQWIDHSVSQLQTGMQEVGAALRQQQMQSYHMGGSMN